MTDTARERRLRRVAAREGMVLRKSRIDGTWMVVNDQNWLLAGGRQADGSGGLGLDEVEEYLSEEVNA